MVGWLGIAKGEYMLYKTHDKKVKIDGEEYEAHMVENHGALDGIIIHTRDANYYDGYSNIRDWKTTFYILPKGSKKWKLLFKGDREDCPVTTDGYFNSLRQLESEENKLLMEIESAKSLIKQNKIELEHCQQYIAANRKALKELKDKAKGCGLKV